jgi:hypothetical protein
MLSKIYPTETHEDEIPKENRTRSHDPTISRRIRGSIQPGFDMNKISFDWNSRTNSERKLKRQTPATIGNNSFLPKIHSQRSIQYNPEESTKKKLFMTKNWDILRQMTIVQNNHIQSLANVDKFGITANFGSNIGNRFKEEKISVASPKESRFWSPNRRSFMSDGGQEKIHNFNDHDANKLILQAPRFPVKRTSRKESARRLKPSREVQRKRVLSEEPRDNNPFTIISKNKPKIMLKLLSKKLKKRSGGLIPLHS